MIVSCTLRRATGDCIVSADADPKTERIALAITRVHVFTARDIEPVSLDAITRDEGREIERLLAADLAYRLAEIAGLPPRIRRLAESAGISASEARALALEAM